MSSRNTPRKQSSSGTRKKKNTAKKGASRSRSAGARSASRSRQAREQVALEEERVHLLPDETRNDIAGVALAIIAIALFIAVVSPGRAMLSSAVSEALLHGVGIGAYIVPFFLLAWAVSFFTRSNIAGIWRTGLGLLLIVLSVISLASLYTPNADLMPTEILCSEEVLVSRGGYVGGGIAWALITLVGRTIATVLLAGVIIAGLIIIGMSISSWFTRSRARAHDAMAREAYEAEQRRFEPDDFAGDGTIKFDVNGDVIPDAKAGRKGCGARRWCRR